MNITPKQIVTIVVVALLSLSVLGVVNAVVSFSNDEITLRNTFDQKMKHRTAFYDGMWKTISQKSQITLKNDSSFQKNVMLIMDGRKDAPNVFMKWVTETNPNANYSEVSKMYQDLSRTVESKRDDFLNEETVIQDVVLQHTNLITIFPGSFYNIFFHRTLLEYKPITSDRTDEVMKTGKDNNVTLF